MIGTLAEMNKYSQTELQRAVIDRLVKDSEVLAMLPFEDLTGNSLTYNTITTDSGAAFYSPGDTWTESTPVLTQATATITILGGDADIDRFALQTRSNKEDMRGIVLGNKVKAIQNTFIDEFYYGSGTAPHFTGLQGLITSSTYNTVSVGTSATGAVLSIAKLRQAIDLLPKQWRNSGKKAMFMTKTLRRGISVYLDSIGEKFGTREVSAWGHPVQVFDDIPIFVDDILLNTELIASNVYYSKTGGVDTSIFILTFDPMAACGLQNGGVQTEDLGSLETKDADRVRIKWYCGLKLEDLRSCVKIDGIVAAGTVTA